MSDKTPEQDSKRSEALIEPDQILGESPNHHDIGQELER